MMKLVSNQGGVVELPQHRLAEVKLLVGRALRSAGHLICNGQQAQDGPLRAPLDRLRAERPDVSVHLFLPSGSAAWAAASRCTR